MSDVDAIGARVLRAETIGGPARAVLTDGIAGMVIAVFRRSFYIETTPSRLACIGPVAMGAGPLNVLCGLPAHLEWEAAGLVPGCGAFVADGRLTLGGAIAIELSGATNWRPPPLTVGPPMALRRGLAALATSLDGRSGNLGLAVVEPPDDPFRRAAMPAMRAFETWVGAALVGVDTAPPETVQGLVGLGPGLTPSGDDYLGGALIALRAFGRDAVADRLADWVLARESRTNTISAAHLRCAATGQGAAALHATLAALCNDAGDELRRCLGEIDAIGHTSGWDALAGAVAVMKIIAGE